LQSGGSSVSRALFDAFNMSKTLRPLYTVNASRDCLDDLRSIIELNPYSGALIHLHHKDFSFALALKRLGMRVFTILRHPIRRAISAFYYFSKVKTRFKHVQDKPSARIIDQMVMTDQVAHSGQCFPS
jgi:hypothetical protein